VVALGRYKTCPYKMDSCFVIDDYWLCFRVFVCRYGYGGVCEFVGGSDHAATFAIVVGGDVYGQTIRINILFPWQLPLVLALYFFVCWSYGFPSVRGFGFGYDHDR